MKDLSLMVFKTEDAARACACCTNLNLCERWPTERELIGFLHDSFPNCMACGEFGMNGRIMNCGYEHLTPVYDEKHGVWRLARERCMIRTWIEILDEEGINPRESEFGCGNELR